MTTPIIPEFVLKLFENEINKIVQGEIKRVCNHYALSYEDVTKKLGRVSITSTETPGFRLMKKNEKFAPDEQRCCARMLHDLEVKQCSRSKTQADMCTMHNNMRKNNRLRYGTIHDPLPDELRPEVLNEKRKKSIY
jgi:hypothetical protein